MASSRHRDFIVQSWYQKSLWLYLLFPLALVYWVLSTTRRLLYGVGLLSSFRSPVPVIVVGNITVGGTGKTPLVIALCQHLQREGITPGVISRGYGGKAPAYPYAVTAQSNALHSGDEPLLIAEQTGVAVVVDANRERAIRYVLANHACDVIIADDGLQHYALQRDIEVVVVDGSRVFGNGCLLPMGPLRESVSRLKQVDYVIGNGRSLDLPCISMQHTMRLQPTVLKSLDDGLAVTFDQWSGAKRVHAVAGIGNPDRFYQTLKECGFDPIVHSYPDHHHYSQGDLAFGDDLPIIMTAKDAVKIRALGSLKHSWYLSVEATVDNDFFPTVIQQIKTLTQQR